MTLVTRPPQITPWCDDGAVGPSADRVVLTSLDTAPGYQFGASALGRQKENGLFWDMHRRTMYHLQGGAPEWGADTDYRAGALVTFSGELYRAPVAIPASPFNPGNAPWVRVMTGWDQAWYTAGSRTWTVPTGCTKLIITMIGGGGGGGSGGVFTSNTAAAGAGGSGGGGATHETFAVPVSPGATITAVVGAGGAPDTDGGDTTVTIGGVTYTAYGAQRGRSILAPQVLFTPGRYAGGATRRGSNPLDGLYTGDSGFQDIMAFGAMLPDSGRGGWGGMAGGSGGDGYGPYLGYGSTGRNIYTGAVPARCGGYNQGNPGGYSGTTAGIQNFGAGGGGGGAGSFPRSWCVYLGLDPCQGGGGGSTSAMGSGSVGNGEDGLGPGSGGGGGAGAGGTDYGSQPGSLAGSGADGAIIIEYSTF